MFNKILIFGGCPDPQTRRRPLPAKILRCFKLIEQSRRFNWLCLLIRNFRIIRIHTNLPLKMQTRAPVHHSPDELQLKSLALAFPTGAAYRGRIIIIVLNIVIDQT